MRVRVLVALIALGWPSMADATARWMSVEAMQRAFIGQRLAGVYASGQPWIESYDHQGGIDYWDKRGKAKGYWSFRGPAFCTFYTAGLAGGCWRAVKTSANCYEFFVEGAVPREGRPRWGARGWRTDSPATCDVGAGV
ncbi:MAG: hypothetical protein R3D31_15240 [Hyphomicrobiaceae bacterium]